METIVNFFFEFKKFSQTKKKEKFPNPTAQNVLKLQVTV